MAEWLNSLLVDLGDVDPKPLAWSPGAEGLLRPTVRTTWFGSRGEGKSLAALVLAEQVTAAGGRVLYVDLENGRRRTAGRVRTILADRETAREGLFWESFAYTDIFRWGELHDEGKRGEWAKYVATRDVLVIDSLARTLGQLGLDENSNRDVTGFMTEYVDPAATSGAAVLILDNTGHTEAGRTRGASTKLDLTESAYKVTGGGSCRVDRRGQIVLEKVRGRDGDEWERAVLGAGGGEYTGIEQREGEKRTARDVVKADVLDLLMEDHLQTGRGMKAADIARGIEKETTDATVSRALKDLVKEGRIVRGDDKVYALAGKDCQ
jgi:AAA domain